MNIPAPSRPTAAFVVGVLLLVPALFMAQIFWGVQLAFTLFRLFSSPNAFVAFFSLSALGALSAALPFGVLFGLAYPAHTWRHAFVFAAIPAFVLLCFGVWVGVWVTPLPSSHPIWLVRVLDALLFTILFPLFAALGAKFGSESVVRVRFASGMFGLLAVAYYFGFDVYYRYIYTNAV